MALADLLEACGYEVETAANGHEALEFLRTRSAPAVIILDLLMPVMDGWEFRAEQKRDSNLAAIPVVALTALRQLPDFDAAAVVHKPVEFKRLLNAITRCSGERA